MANPSGTCPTCGTVCRLTDAGTLPPHRIYIPGTGQWFDCPYEGFPK